DAVVLDADALGADPPDTEAPGAGVAQERVCCNSGGPKSRYRTANSGPGHVWPGPPIRQKCTWESMILTRLCYITHGELYVNARSLSDLQRMRYHEVAGKSRAFCRRQRSRCLTNAQERVWTTGGRPEGCRPGMVRHKNGRRPVFPMD